MPLSLIIYQAFLQPHDVLIIQETNSPRVLANIIAEPIVGTSALLVLVLCQTIKQKQKSLLFKEKRKDNTFF